MSRAPSAAGIGTLATSAVADRRSQFADFVELTKPRIVLLELVTVAVAAHIAAPGPVAVWVLLHAIVGAGLVAASASTFNQWWEQSGDAQMIRTAGRPLPSGRLSSSQVLGFGALTLFLGVVELLWFVGLGTTVLAILTWLIYVLAYTPLKSRSPLNTAVGAVSGALPILIGWTAAGGEIDIRAFALTAVVFLWQFPHFMAIAWLHREDYARAGQKMLTVVDPSGVRAGAQAVVGALALVPVSLVPALSPQAGSPAVYCVWAALLAAGLVAAAANFLWRRDDRSARTLLRASLLYLTCWMGLLLVVSC